MRTLLAIDQGTSSTKALVFDEHGLLIAKSTVELETNPQRKSGHPFNPLIYIL